MRFIEIDFDSVTVRAQLREDFAPKTTQAIWDALPFGGRAVHAQLSGDMFRMLDPTPIEELELESDSGHQHPGSVVYYPPLKEIAFCYKIAQFGGETGPAYVTPFAEIEGDLTKFGARADSILFDGALPISFKRAEDQETPFRFRTIEGPKIEVDFDGASLMATLLQESAPETVEAFLAALPLEGVATNDDWGGKLTRFRASGGEGDVDLKVSKPEASTGQVRPGYIYYDYDKKRVYACYGDAALKDLMGVRPVTAIAAFDGDWAAYGDKAAAQLTEGAKNMAFRRVD